MVALRVGAAVAAMAAMTAKRPMRHRRSTRPARRASAVAVAASRRATPMRCLLPSASAWRTGRLQTTSERLSMAAVSGSMGAAAASPPARPPGVDAFIGMGSNLGDRKAELDAARSELAALPETVLLRASSYYESAPLDADGADYLNAVAWVRTSLRPLALLRALQSIEDAHGRDRPYRHAPRRLDLDLLLYANEMVITEALTLPHPRLHERAFVLAPLAELAPDADVPGRGKVESLLDAVAEQRISRLPST